ncbi:IS110 family transposase [Streptomyces sp. NBC_00316]|nr:IS110 family transposase [Streptomyces sp. NBC_00316]
MDTGDIDVHLGLDVGKGEHHATTVTPAGKKAFDKRLPNTGPKLRELFAKLQAKHGTVLVVVDQPASIGALPPAVARDMGCSVAYLPGLTMRRIADLCPGEVKTDARDAFIIAVDLRARLFPADSQSSEAVRGICRAGTGQRLGREPTRPPSITRS